MTSSRRAEKMADGGGGGGGGGGGRVVRVGSRRSDLALAQTREVCAALQRAYPDTTFTITTMDTTGDKVRGPPLPARPSLSRRRTGGS